MNGHLGFKLKRPCAKCPFRTDCMPEWLNRGRAAEIASSITHKQETFACHETTEVGGGRPGAEQHCAGALIMLDNSGIGIGQFARIAARLGELNLDALDLEAPVFSNPSQFVAHHEGTKEAESCSIVDAGCEAPAGYAVGGAAVENFNVEPGVTKECERCGEPVCDNCSETKDGKRLCGWCAE